MFSLLLIGLTVSLSVMVDVSFCQGSCEQGWVSYSGQCYQFFSLMKTWSDAETFCFNLGGHLASVHNADDNKFITNFIKRKDMSGPTIWLGASNYQQISLWLWTDGSKWDFTNWNTGEPNNSNNVERCLHFNYAVEGGWNDVDCGWEYPFVCVKASK
ncbi:lectin-like [Erpetoichthys calabaricus]|uniref:lectin-like n=1 Tax=Erpetoichthys calabaricus TaxID=27687 RepID=UPI00109F12E0|nr:lectin-like [Erpetoichthys calabaricus]XP_051787833.1 lectin-like [Erpetoichthys calabaricus]